MTFKARDRNWNVQHVLSVATISGAIAFPGKIGIAISVVGFVAVASVFCWQYYVSGFKYTISDRVFEIAHRKTVVEIPFRRMQIRDFDLGVIVVNMDSGNEFPILDDTENYTTLRMALQERIEASKRRQPYFEMNTED